MPHLPDATTILRVRSLRHYALLLAFLAATIGGLAADTAPPPPTKPIDAPVVLPKFEVTAQRGRQIDREIARVDKLIARASKQIKSTDLDKTLNNEKLTRAAAIFGGNSADHLSAVAASRVMLLEQERMVLEAMRRPATLEERNLMAAEIEQLRIARRNLDDAAKQR